MLYRDESSGESREISPSTPSSSESISPFTTSSNLGKRKVLTKPLLNCAICGGKTKCRHFGALSCNACAAFFRRTIAEKRKYSCMQKENCILLSNLVRRMCRFCRFKKCVESGMQEDEVLSIGSSNTSSSTDISTPTSIVPVTNQYDIIKIKQKQKPTILKFSFSTSTNGTSNDILRNLLYCFESIVPNRLSISPTVTLDTEKPSFMPESYEHIYHEAKVFLAFFKSTGLEEFVKNHNLDACLGKVSKCWNVSQMMYNTVKFDGISQNRVYLIDHTYLPLTDEGLSSWYRSDPEVAKDSECMTRLSSSMWRRAHEICRQFGASRFSNIEMACFFALVITSSIIHYSSDNIEMRKSLEPFTNQIFRGLSQYYSENYSSDVMACKIGNIVMMLSLLMEVNSLVCENRQQLLLCGKNIPFEQTTFACVKT